MNTFREHAADCVKLANKHRGRMMMVSRVGFTCSAVTAIISGITMGQGLTIWAIVDFGIAYGFALLAIESKAEAKKAFDAFMKLRERALELSQLYDNFP